MHRYLPFFLLAVALTELFDYTGAAVLRINTGLGLDSRLGQPFQSEDGEPHTFMMISRSTFIPSTGSGENNQEEGVFSIDMTIIEIIDPEPPQNRKVAKPFGSIQPLTLDGPSWSRLGAPDSSEAEGSNQASEKPATADESTPHARSHMLNRMWDAFRQGKVKSPFYSNFSPAEPKPDEEQTFNPPTQPQLVLGSTSRSFDSNSHHSQL